MEHPSYYASQRLTTPEYITITIEPPLSPPSPPPVPVSASLCRISPAARPGTFSCIVDREARTGAGRLADLNSPGRLAMLCFFPPGSAARHGRAVLGRERGESVDGRRDGEGRRQRQRQTYRPRNRGRRWEAGECKMRISLEAERTEMMLKESEEAAEGSHSS